MKFRLCNFGNNSAKIGRVFFLLLSDENYNSTNNQAVFWSCNWTYNSAKYSAAVDLSRPERSAYTRHALIPTFINCSFRHNYLVHSTTEIAGSSVNYSVLGKGTFMALYFTIVFQTYVCFENNSYSGSALYLLSSNASFSAGITAIFRTNHGITGGAFSLKASSVININPHSTFQIHDNTASSVGGAIYYNSIGEHELHDQTNNCMFNIASTIDGVTLNFSGNTQRNNVVNSVYFSPLNACVEPCSDNSSTRTKTLLSCNYYVTFYNDTPEEVGRKSMSRDYSFS